MPCWIRCGRFLLVGEMGWQNGSDAGQQWKQGGSWVGRYGANGVNEGWSGVLTCENVLERLLYIGSVEGRSLDERQVVLGCDEEEQGRVAQKERKTNMGSAI